MQPSKLVARLDALLQPALGIEAARPSVALLDEGNELLTDAELGGDLLLHPTLRQFNDDAPVTGVQSRHARPLSSDDTKCQIGLVCLDVDERSDGQQKALNIRRIGDGVAVEAAMPALNAPTVFLNASIADPLVHHAQDGTHSVGKPQPDAALVLVDFNATFPVKEARDVAPKGFFAPVVHDYNLTQSRVANNIVTAVPVVRWIGERIEMVEAIAAQALAA